MWELTADRKCLERKKKCRLSTFPTQLFLAAFTCRLSASATRSLPRCFKTVAFYGKYTTDTSHNYCFQNSLVGFYLYKVFSFEIPKRKNISYNVTFSPYFFIRLKGVCCHYTHYSSSYFSQRLFERLTCE
jgi:hypothetical protein